MPVFTKAEISFAISSPLCCWSHGHTTGPLNLKEYLETCSNMFNGRTLSRRNRQYCHFWDTKEASGILWKVKLLRAALSRVFCRRYCNLAAAQGQKKLRGYAITLSFPSLSQRHHTVFLQRSSLWDKFLKVLLRKVLLISSSKFLKLEKERDAPPVGSGAPLASLSVIGLEEEEFRRSRWLCRAQRGSLTSLPVVI